MKTILILSAILSLSANAAAGEHCAKTRKFETIDGKTVITTHTVCEVSK